MVVTDGAAAPRRSRPLVFSTNCVKAVPLKLKVKPMFWAAELASSVLAVAMAVPVAPRSVKVPATFWAWVGL